MRGADREKNPKGNILVTLSHFNDIKCHHRAGKVIVGVLECREGEMVDGLGLRRQKPHVPAPAFKGTG